MNETKKTGKQTKTAYRVIYAAEYANEKTEEMKVLNIYKLNIYHVLTFMFKIKRDTVAAAFQNDFGEISRRDPTGFSLGHSVEPNKICCFVSRSKGLE